jgi:hypothetical protein
MKNIFFTLALLISLSSFSQSDLKEEFQNYLTTYADAYNDGDWDYVSSSWYPKLFEVLPKNQLIQQLQQLIDMGFDMSLLNPRLYKISEIVNYEGLQYCRLYYNSLIIIKITGDQFDVNILEQNFNMMYGKENITYDGVEKKYSIKANQSMIAVLEIDGKEWKYFEYNEKEKEFLKFLLPEYVYEKLNN